MNDENLTEAVVEEINEINNAIKRLHDEVKSEYEDLIKEVEYRRSLGEDI